MSAKSRKRGGRRPRKPRPAGAAAASASDDESAAESVAVAAEKRPKPAKRISPDDERPPAPWGNFPLAELTILGGIICLPIGLFLGGGPTFIGVGVALAGVGGMEVALREHLAGYRSHTTMLAGFVFVVVVGLLFYAFKQTLAVALPIGAAAFLLAFYLARRAFQRASGGMSFRIGGMRG